MKIVPVYLWKQLASGDNGEGLLVPSEQPGLRKVIEQRGIRLRRPRDQNSTFLERITSNSRVFIIEGISGSGKDTFQAHLKKKFKNRDVYDYTEGEVLHSWKQLQIAGILEVRIRFMKLFVKYVSDIISRDDNAVFLLNRFHLSTYASTITQEPKLEREYDEIVSVLRILPIHVFILQLDENEIETRSLHPERSGAWQKFQRQIVKNDTFRDRLERQQRLMLEAAKRQQIPYSVLKLPYEPEIGDRQVRASKAPSIVIPGLPLSAAQVKISRKKRHLPTL